MNINKDSIELDPPMYNDSKAYNFHISMIKHILDELNYADSSRITLYKLDQINSHLSSITNGMIPEALKESIDEQ